MSLDEGQTHHVGDGCQPAHDPRIDQAPADDVSEHYDARVAAEAYRRASTGTGPVSFEELHAEYLVEIDAKVRAEKEVERLRAELAASNHISAGHLQACVIAEADAERLRTLIDKHNDECRECPVIELDSDKAPKYV
jgi:hypothetical protein